MVRRLGVVGALAGILAGVVPGAAVAADRTMTAQEGRAVTRSFPPIVGNENATQNPPSGCDAPASGCVDVPLVVPRPRHRGDVASVRIEVGWPETSVDGGVANTDDVDLQLWTRPLTHSEEASGMPLRSSTGVSDPNVINVANPTTTTYDLVVMDAYGGNRGFSVTILYRTGASTVASQVFPPGFPPAVSVSQAPGGVDAPAESGPAPRAAGSASAANPDRSFAGARPIADVGAGAAGSARHAIMVWTAVAAILIAGVGWAMRRVAWGRPEGVAVAVGRGPASWPRRAPRLEARRARLFWKLLAPFLAVILVIGAGGTFLTVRYLADRAQTNLDQTALRSSAAADAYIRDQELSLLDAVRFAANIDGLPEALGSNDGGRVAQLLGSAAAVHTSLALIAAADDHAVGVAEFGREQRDFVQHRGTDFASVPAVASVIAGVVDSAGDKHSGFLRLADGTALLIVAAPVRTDHLVGVAIAGASADDLAIGAARQSGTEIGLYDGAGALMGGSTGGIDRSVAVAAGIVRQRLHGDEIVDAPLVNRGVRVGTLSSSAPVGRAFASVRGAAGGLAALVGLAMLAVVILGVVVTRRILRQVEPLVETNRALGRGDLSARAPVRTTDELGELAEGFNQMADQLQASYEELERRVAERTEELSRLYQENVRVSEARSQFFASISHEFRTPLFAILANAELMADSPVGTTTEATEFLGTITGSATGLLDRVNELLDLARSDASGIDLTLAPVDLGALAAEASAAARPLAHPGGVTVEVAGNGKTAPVRGDEARLRQVLQNLLSNAIKYTPPGGRVTVSTRSLREDVLVSVADTGIGIPEGVGDRVFEPYYRVEGSEAQRHLPSSGLGLALALRLVEAHGGRLWFEPTPGGGTTFSFTIPRAPAP